MKTGWSSERRARQAILIRTWKPWEQSTGPKSDVGKAASASPLARGILADDTEEQLEQDAAAFAAWCATSGSNLTLGALV